MDEVTAEKGYAGPVVVCSVGYEPIAGHRPSTPLVKYLSEGREMEVALAPVAGTRLLAPFRVSVVSMLANLVIEANRFEATARPLGASTVPEPKAAQCDACAVDLKIKRPWDKWWLSAQTLSMSHLLEQKSKMERPCAPGIHNNAAFS